MKKTKVNWNSIDLHGYPPKEEQKYEINEGIFIDRTFLVKGEYSIFTAYLFPDGSGFDMPEHSTDTPIEWAIIDGF